MSNKNYRPAPEDHADISAEFRRHVTAFIYKFRDNIKGKTTETSETGISAKLPLPWKQGKYK
jgi:hypothetical protein